MKNIINLSIFLIFSASAPSVFAQTPRINFTAPLLYPEGIAYHPKNQLIYVSSVKYGMIGTIDQQGNYKEFYTDKNLISSFGMKVDEKANVLWVCLADPNANYSIYSSPATLKKMARVISVDLTTGKKKMDIDLSKLYAGKHFINDLTIDDMGNLYLTDSFSPVIYKVDAKGKSSVFAENKLFKSEDIGLNGIAYQSGMLITVNNGTGAILRVDINNPKMVDMVKIDQLFPGADGLLFEKGELVLVQNKGVNKVYRIKSNDNWRSAKLTGATAGDDRFAQPSTQVSINGVIWALNSKLNELSNPTMPPSMEFSVQKAEFRPVE
ncbi:MAG: gluconolaconase [Pedobacter sp.]|nr:gluconolaconase [Pedobacter sp.]MDQ8053849.1 gluconolaconase [Pedobacter sp.]